MQIYFGIFEKLRPNLISASNIIIHYIYDAEIVFICP